MFSYSLCCVIVLVLVAIAATEGQSGQKQGDIQPIAGIFADSLRIHVDNPVRRARAVSRTPRGIAAIRKLLEGAHEVKTRSKNFRSYKKDGDLKTALRDFESVSPVVMKPSQKRQRLNFGRLSYGRNNKHHEYNTLMGKVGDTRLILLKQGDTFSRGLPVLEIRRPLDPLYDRIVYQITGN